MQSVYVETSVISHAAARLRRVQRIAVLQQEARRWWAECRPNYRVVTSQFVIDEASMGDPDAAARIDALHVASAAIGGVNYLVTQNFTHLANAVTIRMIDSVLDRLGLGPLLICTPTEFLGGRNDGQE